MDCEYVHIIDLVKILWFV